MSKRMFWTLAVIACVVFWGLAITVVAS